MKWVFQAHADDGSGTKRIFTWDPSYQHERPEGPSVSKVRNQARPRGSQVVTASWSPQDSGPHAHHPRDVLSHFILNSCPCLAKFTTQASSPYISKAKILLSGISCFTLVTMVVFLLTFICRSL